MKRLHFSTLSLVFMLGATGAMAQGLPGHSMVSATDLKWADLPSLPPGAKIAVMEVLDVSKGMALPAGGFTVMPVKTPHFAYTTNEPVEIQLHGTGPWGITYLNPADDPRKKQQ